MPSDPKKLLYDVSHACMTIGDFCRGRSAQDYERDLMLQSACERQLEIIGEAMTRLRDRHADVFDQITEAREIIAFRNRLIHGYDSVDHEIVWDVIGSKLPKLRHVTERLLHENT